MKKLTFGRVYIVLVLIALISCISSEPNNQFNNNTSSNNYWFQGKAEITSFELKQARYGEIHEGEAVLIYVSEPFSQSSFTKADTKTDNDIDVLKLNFTKNFTTGIYPYHMMTSTFYPFQDGIHSLKISSSSQEWCGHTYMEMKPSENEVVIKIDSYFQGETTNDTLKKSIFEDDLWSMIRLHPNQLPQGKLEMIPSFFYLRLKHKPTQAYTCLATLVEEQNRQVYSIEYPDIQRTLEISFEKQAPYKIIGWKETYASGWGNDTKMLTTTARRKKTMLTDYWNKNKKQFTPLRNELELKP